MKIHPAGYKTIFVSTVILIIINVCFYYFNDAKYSDIILLISVIIYLFLIWFFRNPSRTVVLDRDAVIAPCDGKVVLIQEIEEKEFFESKCIQIGIFMSPLNVHMNWYPVSGIIKLSKHFKGKYVAAFKPKSSLLNERHYTLIYTLNGFPVLVKQIAGALTRKILNYAIPGKTTLQSKEMGFIKFGSRVDVLLPIGSKILVEKGQKVKGAQTKLAYLTKN